MIQVQALPGDHDRQGFDCVRQELNHWLRQVARQHQDNGLAKTFVAVREDPPISICGYYALTLAELENRPDGRVGRLHVTASEWPLYDMKSDLTVLSACDTGVGRTQAGESVMGLPYALFVAGNKNMLLGLWPVDDDATTEFMRRFFTKLKAGTPQPDALRQTKQEFRQHPSWSDPKYWAAFVL